MKYVDVKNRILHKLSPCDEKETNRYRILTENCFYNVAANLVGGNFLTGLLIYLKASTVQIGLVNVIVYLCNTFQLLSPLLLNRFEKRKKLLIISRIIVLFSNIVLIGIVCFLPFQNSVQVALVLICIALLNIVSASTAQGVSLWHMGSIPENRRATHFSQSTAFNNLAIYIFVLLGSSVLDHFKAEGEALAGFTILRIAALFFAAGDIFWLTKIKEYPYEDTKGPVKLKAIFTEPFKHKQYLPSILILFFWNFVATTSGSYYTVYMLDTLNMSYSFINICAALYVPMVFLVRRRWANYIDRTSWLSTLYKVLFAYGIIFFTHALVMEGTEWFYLIVALLCYIFSPALNIILPNMSFYHLPKESQTICLSVSSTFANLGAMCGTYYAIFFMSAFQDCSFELFGKTFVTGQIMPCFTGAMIILFGLFVYRLHQKEQRAKREKEESQQI